MSAREFFNNNPAIVTGGAAFVLVVCLTVIACQLFGGGGSSNRGGNAQLIYYDMSSNTVKLVPAKDQPTTPLADNAQAYRAVIMSCGECSDITDGMSRADIENGGMFVAYIQSMPETNGQNNEPMMMMEMSMLIADIDQQQWMLHASDQGAMYMREVVACPGDARARQCNP